MKTKTNDKQNTEQKNSGPATPTAPPPVGAAPVDFDAAAMEAELEAVRQKHLKGVQDRLEDFESKRDELDVEIDRLRQILGLGIGRKKTGRATARLSDEVRAKAEADAIAFIAENKDGVGRAAAIAKLGLDKAQTGRLLKGLVAAGKLRKLGNGSAARYVTA